MFVGCVFTRLVYFVVTVESLTEKQKGYNKKPQENALAQAKQLQ